MEKDFLFLDTMCLYMCIISFQIRKISVDKMEQKRENILIVTLRDIVYFKISVKDLRLNGPRNCVVKH